MVRKKDRQHCEYKLLFVAHIKIMKKINTTGLQVALPLIQNDGDDGVKETE